MKVVIAGSRHLSDYASVVSAVEESWFPVTEVVSGCARGADTLGERFARERGIPVKKFPANWDMYGKSAGPIRNRQMAEYADAAIVIMFPDSRGSANMVRTMDALGKPVFVVEMPVTPR